MSVKSGRPRRYDLHPQKGSLHQDVGTALAALDELCERLYDLITDLPQQAAEYIPEGSGINSITMLVIHMAWAEASWVARITQTPLDPALEQLLLPGQQTKSGDLPPSATNIPQLIALCRRVRQEVSKPRLTLLDDIDRAIPGTKMPMTARGVLMHLIWHWTYHSGQVGLLRRLWGTRYRWTFDKKLGDPVL